MELKLSNVGYKNLMKSEAVLDLQAVLNLTAFRLLKTLPERVFSSEKNSTLVFKWGFDCSSGHVSYKQRFRASTILTTSIVQLVLHDKVKNRFG